MLLCLKGCLSAQSSLSQRKKMPIPQETPEEKLLKIIESPKSQNTKQSGFRKAGLGLANFNLLFDFKGLDLKIANRFFGISIAIVVCIIVVDFFYVNQNNSAVLKGEDLKKDEDEQGLEFAIPKASELALSDYMSVLKDKGLFGMVEEEENIDPTKTAEKINLLQDAIKDFAVVGILWSQAQPQVMIEDKKDTKTYFLKEGDKLKEIKIEKIYKDKVTLSLGEDRLDIR